MLPETGIGRKVLITGGAGFIGSNLAAHLLATTDAQIVLFDNFSTPGSELNLAWLNAQAETGRLKTLRGDVRSAASVARAAQQCDEIYHLANSATGDTLTDFKVNVHGTRNVVNAARKSSRQPLLVFASTSRVYGPLTQLPVVSGETRFLPADSSFRGVQETAPVHLDPPYSCSVGMADALVRDAIEKHGLHAVLLRIDCVAGPRQFAVDHHCWLAHIATSILSGQPIHLHGSGLEVYDLLHVSDVVEAMVAASAYIGVTAGKAYNVGGGATRSISTLEMIDMVERLCHRKTAVSRTSISPGLRPLYYADGRKFLADTNWRVRKTLEDTVRDLAAFWRANREALAPAPRLEAATVYTRAA